MTEENLLTLLARINEDKKLQERLSDSHNKCSTLLAIADENNLMVRDELCCDDF